VSLVAFHGSTWETDFDKKIETYFLNYFGYSPAIKRFTTMIVTQQAPFLVQDLRKHSLTMDNSGDGVSTQIAVGKQQ
jgi:hypothetical protein